MDSAINYIYDIIKNAVSNATPTISSSKHTDTYANYIMHKIKNERELKKIWQRQKTPRDKKTAQCNC